MHLFYTALYAVALFFLIFLFVKVPSLLRNRTSISTYGCKPIRHVVWTREPLLGLDYIVACVREARAGYYMRYLASRFTSFGPTYATRRVAFETLHTSDPENLKYMLATGFDNYKLATLRINAMVPLFGQGIFTTNGAAWQHSRAILRPSFTKQNMAPLLAMMERHFQMLRKQIPADGATAFDVQKLFFDFTMDTATEFLMGRSTYTLDRGGRKDAERGFVEDYMACCYEAVRQIAFGPLQFLSVTPKGIPAARKRAWAYVDQFVDEALARRESRKGQGLPGIGHDDEGQNEGVAAAAAAEADYNFLEELAMQTTNRTLLRDQVLNVLLASRDTTAALLSNMFYELARKPQLYSKLRKEVLERIQGPLPTEAEMNSMRYLRWCLNEALRMYPVVPGNTREATCDTILPVGGGPDGKSPIFVKKGTPVFYNVYAMHHRKDIYGKDADEFNPDRWDGLRPGWGFLPFNGGPRICLGQQFALTEASYVTVRMLQTFEVLEPRDERPWMEQYSLVMCSKNGVQVSVKAARE